MSVFALYFADILLNNLENFQLHVKGFYYVYHCSLKLTYECY